MAQLLCLKGLLLGSDGSADRRTRPEDDEPRVVLSRPRPSHPLGRSGAATSAHAAFAAAALASFPAMAAASAASTAAIAATGAAPALELLRPGGAIVRGAGGVGAAAGASEGSSRGLRCWGPHRHLFQ
jgi:hypothetical protein